MNSKPILTLVTLALSASWAIAADQALITKSHDISGSCYYEVTIKAEIDNADMTNLQAIAACYFEYTSRGKPVRIDDGLITGSVPANPQIGYEYLFADRAQFSGHVGTWVFQVRAPAPADRLVLKVKEWKNISLLSVKDVIIRKMGSSLFFKTRHYWLFSATVRCATKHMTRINIGYLCDQWINVQSLGNTTISMRSSAHL